MWYRALGCIVALTASLLAAPLSIIMPMTVTINSMRIISIVVAVWVMSTVVVIYLFK
jgi:hypothetical protein